MRRGLCIVVAGDSICSLAVMMGNGADAAVVDIVQIGSCLCWKNMFVSWAFHPGGVGMGNLGYGGGRRGLCMGCSGVAMKIKCLEYSCG